MATLPTPKGYYVYELVDPFGDEVFYVGKGKGRRMYAHDREARTLTGGNREKHERIATIHRLGGEVRYRVVEDGLTERAAFALERKRIGQHGIHNLTNAVPGQNDPDFKVRLRGQKLMAKLRLPGPWLYRQGKQAVRHYWLIRRFMGETAKYGRSPQTDAAAQGERRRKRAQQYSLTR